ncbi:M20 aminoacylase family protein [Donghicola eburneus]|uniref:Amidohydrolase n=1 Tax=Donghicola eburneus TaxID=393278 RepID=A0A1M4N373_9RHOB|nr:M20 aminoacylase family protein [Donghicola eburneus]SCM68527.1 amidohydrolase [Donghicola eburneus]SFQ26475.1 hippurate hydrolase [Donghicola eburneus]
MPLKNRFAEMLPEITAWRRDFHANPELLFDVHRTADTVADKLREFGCDKVVTGIGRTGVVGIIKGREEGRTIGLRADMDALPITEATGKPYASQNAGKMHACGHDGHTSMLLGAAKYLAETRNFAGTAVVIFQPAEEGGGGGREMCEDGLMFRFGIEEVYGMHNWPGIPAGKFAIRPGGFFAATDQFEIIIHGRGGHAAKPHETTDPIVTASHVVTAMQTIASRSVDPVHQVVVSVTSIESSSKAFNVIPEKVTMKGTFRTLDKDVRHQTEERIKAVATQSAAALGAVAEVKIYHGYPVMVNADENTVYAADVARSLTGQCDEAPLIMGGEDFAYMLEERPGAYILVGNGDSAPVHHPEYDFNDEIIPAGCSWFVGMVEARLPLRA